MFSDRVRLRLEHVIENADWIADDVDGIGLERFRADRRRADAVERCLERIAEAIVQMGDVAVKEADLGVALEEVRGLGNKLRHEYGRIDRKIIYDTARDDVPPLRVAAARALAL